MTSGIRARVVAAAAVIVNSMTAVYVVFVAFLAVQVLLLAVALLAYRSALRRGGR